MIAKTYNTESSVNTINKDINFIADIDVKFKDEVNIYNPTIVLKYDDLIDFNYIYIDKFKRYYFIEDIKVFPNKIYNISLKCDVLMSFKDDILNSYGNIARQTNYNDYYNFNYSSEVRKESNIYNSNVVFEDVKTTVLCTIGGV
jgi:hypothetical protein